jgi:hypothetical protein
MAADSFQVVHCAIAVGFAWFRHQVANEDDARVGAGDPVRDALDQEGGDQACVEAAWADDDEVRGLEGGKSLGDGTGIDGLETHSANLTPGQSDLRLARSGASVSEFSAQREVVQG